MVLCELFTIAFIRYRFIGGKPANVIVQAIVGGGIVSRPASGLDVSAQGKPEEDKRTTAKEYCHEDRIHRIRANGRRHGVEPPEGRP
jgi:hypothetical protein